MSVTTGTVEPTWPTVAGAQVIEYVGLGDTATAPPPPSDPTPTLPPDVVDRYEDLRYDTYSGMIR